MKYFRHVIGTAFLISYVAVSLANDLRNSVVTEDQFVNATLSLVSSRRQFGVNYSRILLNGANLELWDTKKKILYFSLPKDSPPQKTLLKNFLRDPEKIQEAKLNGTKLELNGLFLLRTKEKFTLLATPETNFQIQQDLPLQKTFDSTTYSFTPMDFAQSLRNQFVYGGKLRVTKVPDGIERPAFVNHGAFVSMQGEPTLNSLVKRLIGNSVEREYRIQTLLDFVTNSIRYDEKEFFFGGEFLQRANETILAGEGDCSNKAILLASLLEQEEIEYLLVYTAGHIYVAVPQGNFPNDNGYSFAFRGKRWAAAETTAKGFKIGITKVTKEDAIRAGKYVQIPREKNKLFTFNDEKMIMFN
jgi:hypothetical protein